MDYKMIENELIAIYENGTNDKFINARELYTKLGSKQKFANCIKNPFFENTIKNSK